MIQPKLEGVFASKGEEEAADMRISYRLLYFSRDGVVLSTHVVVDTSLPAEWPNIRKWFRVGSEAAIQQASYRTEDATVRFSVPVPGGEIDYWGTFTENELLLDVYSNATGFGQAGVRYTRLQFATY